MNDNLAREELILPGTALRPLTQLCSVGCAGQFDGVAQHARHHFLHPGAKLDVPVIDAGNPLVEAMELPGVVEAGGQLSVHVPTDQVGGPNQFTIGLQVSNCPI